MYPSVSLQGAAACAPAPAIRALLYAAASLGRDGQPRLYRHIHPHGHANARLARSFAAVLGRAAFGAPTLDEIELGGHLRDFGKYLFAESILLKLGPLDEEERAAVSFHLVNGAHLHARLPAVTDAVRQVVLYHHERWDGDGYPEGPRGDASRRRSVSSRSPTFTLRCGPGEPTSTRSAGAGRRP